MIRRGGAALLALAPALLAPAAPAAAGETLRVGVLKLASSATASRSNSAGSSSRRRRAAVSGRRREIFDRGGIQHASIGRNV
jgi:hypothetical protein